jgi:trimeric autotransporter adhesin
VAGNGNEAYSGDGGPATNACLNFPERVVVDGSDDLFIADTDNNVIRKVTSTQGPTLTLNEVTAANAGNYQVVVTGPGGSVTSSVAKLTLSGPIVRLSVLSWTTNGFNLSLTGPTGSYQINVSTNLLNWLTLTSFTTTSSPVSFLDSAAKSYRQRYYRAAWVP